MNAPQAAGQTRVCPYENLEDLRDASKCAEIAYMCAEKLDSRTSSSNFSMRHLRNILHSLQARSGNQRERLFFSYAATKLMESVVSYVIEVLPSDVLDLLIPIGICTLSLFERQVGPWKNVIFRIGTVNENTQHLNAIQHSNTMQVGNIDRKMLPNREQRQQRNTGTTSRQEIMIMEFFSVSFSTEQEFIDALAARNMQKVYISPSLIHLYLYFLEKRSAQLIACLKNAGPQRESHEKLRKWITRTYTDMRRNGHPLGRELLQDLLNGVTLAENSHTHNKLACVLNTYNHVTAYQICKHLVESCKSASVQEEDSNVTPPPVAGGGGGGEPNNPATEALRSAESSTQGRLVVLCFSSFEEYMGEVVAMDLPDIPLLPQYMNSARPAYSQPAFFTKIIMPAIQARSVIDVSFPPFFGEVTPRVDAQGNRRGFIRLRGETEREKAGLLQFLYELIYGLRCVYGHGSHRLSCQNYFLPHKLEQRMGCFRGENKQALVVSASILCTVGRRQCSKNLTTAMCDITNLLTELVHEVTETDRVAQPQAQPSNTPPPPPSYAAVTATGIDEASAL